MLTVGALFDGSLFALDHLSFAGAGSIAFLGVLGTALSFTWYARAVRDIGPTRAGMFINLVPVFGVLLGALLLFRLIYYIAPFILALTLLGLYEIARRLKARPD
jgi:drug/metabolite transporter (DMT)-like permease